MKKLYSVIATIKVPVATDSVLVLLTTENPTMGLKMAEQACSSSNRINYHRVVVIRTLVDCSNSETILFMAVRNSSVKKFIDFDCEYYDEFAKEKKEINAV